MATFKDFFSQQSATYQKYRPTYPAALFVYLASLTDAHELAWDCGTGNGQAARGLVAQYAHVYATDPSAQQLRQATPHERITYREEKAEHTSLAAASADLVTVAQALHWFAFDRFYAGVKRVLKPGGVLAVWTYGLPAVSPEVDRLVQQFHDQTVGPFWQPENKWVVQGYTTLPFPFEMLTPPSFRMHRTMTLPDLVGLVASWSAVQRFKAQRGFDPVASLAQELAAVWHDPATPWEATWTLILKVGRHTTT
ncbi:Methyltransferase domain-containing protein [Catalinimonas alkaloidigena]|uniref:Methyltransferase domain-containing protein n=1 Tax=Catalinimonas alkaloidigena TaxID=1075417 RepID=A0A1G9RB28_9BACT|nr:class I SAM-dependent methyltransferase [Catalinimonas alkaloidigena]SDM19605.1 Methyltransferase domain-containing protein [Catalinimonas alkaloidigena]